MWTEQLQADYELLLAGEAVAPLDDHFAISLAGEDRHAFLHNFCTANIKDLPKGQCCEAFVLNGKGKTMAFVHVLAFSDAIWLVAADAANAKALIEHLDKYIIREDVQLANLTDDIRMFFAPEASAAVKIGLQEQQSNECCVMEIDSTSVRTANVEFAGLGSWLSVEIDSLAEFESHLQNSSVSVALTAALNSIRIERKTPWSGFEADESNLPQELQRDEKAISFAKGCYLGQETVARLDALGRVNQLLVSVHLGKEPVPVGVELQADEKKVGRVTSVAWSPESNQWIGFAFVRRAHAKAGSKLQVADGGTETVVA